MPNNVSNIEHLLAFTQVIMREPISTVWKEFDNFKDTEIFAATRLDDPDKPDRMGTGMSFLSTGVYRCISCVCTCLHAYHRLKHLYRELCCLERDTVLLWYNQPFFLCSLKLSGNRSWTASAYRTVQLSYATGLGSDAR